MTWQSSDTSVVTIDSVGLARGGRIGTAVITARARFNQNLIAQVTVRVASAGAPVQSLTVSPSQLTLVAADTARLRPTLVLDPTLPAGTSRALDFRTTDSCHAVVDSTGLVTAVGFGGVADILVASRAYPTVTQRVPVVTLGPLRGANPFTIQRITIAGAPTAVDPTAVRGAVDVTVNLGRVDFLAPGRIEATLGGRLVASAPFGRFTPGQDMMTFMLRVDTDQRDASGARLFANGAAALELRAVADSPPTIAGCPRSAGGSPLTIGISLTLANP